MGGGALGRVNGRRLGRRTAGVGRSEPSPFLNSGHSSPRKLPFAASSNIEAESDHAKQLHSRLQLSLVYNELGTSLALSGEHGGEAVIIQD